MSAPTSRMTAGSSVKMPTRQRRSPGCPVPLALHHPRTHEAAPPGGGAAVPSLALRGRGPDHGVALLLILRSGGPAEVRIEPAAELRSRETERNVLLILPVPPHPACPEFKTAFRDDPVIRLAVAVFLVRDDADLGFHHQGLQGAAEAGGGFRDGADRSHRGSPDLRRGPVPRAMTSRDGRHRTGLNPSGPQHSGGAKGETFLERSGREEPL